MFEGPYGSTHALTRALERKGLSFNPKGTASPFNKADLDSLISLIKSDIENNVISNDVVMKGETKIVYDTLKSVKDIFTDVFFNSCDFVIFKTSKLTQY